MPNNPRGSSIRTGIIRESSLLRKNIDPSRHNFYRFSLSLMKGTRPPLSRIFAI